MAARRTPVRLSLGVDIGQRVDPSALCLAEPRGTGTETEWHIRHLERRPLGEAYPRVAQRVAAVVMETVRYLRTSRWSGGAPNAGEIISGWDFDLTIDVTLDATGVGRPVCELVTQALDDLDAKTWQFSTRAHYAVFTYGDHLTYQAGELRVGKAWLVSRLQALGNTDRIHLPTTSESLALMAELLDYQIKVDPDGDAKFGAFKTGSHDDLVTALGLAVLEDRHQGVTGSINYLALQRVRSG